MRPRFIDSPEQFDMLIDLYVLDCIENKKSMSIVGMALALGLTGKTSFNQYGERPEFEASVSRAKSLIEQQYLDRVTNGSAERGNIFLLKAVYDYRDTHHIAVAPMRVVIEGKDAAL